MSNTATHKEPVLRRKANFIIRADLGQFGMPGRFEQLWARKLDEFRFEICCIPFYTYGIALGDTVETNAGYTIHQVIQKGGHRTLRIAVANADKQEAIHVVLHDLVENSGLLYEWYSIGYLAVDLGPNAQGLPFCDELDKLVKLKEISMELD